jgi:histone deacetylase 1/2
MAKRARPDILLAISFLTTRVQDPTEDDWKKLERVCKYLNGTRNMELSLSVVGNLKMHCYIDASYATHSDAKGRTGSVLTFGGGAVKSMSTKQGIVAKSSTEAEIIGVSDTLGANIGLMYFLEEQGYIVRPIQLYQDNKSSITLMEKGRSTSNRTKHIATRYFFVKDRIISREVIISHMATEEMIADFFTKPLQGELFRKLRDKVMGVTFTVQL